MKSITEKAAVGVMTQAEYARHRGVNPSYICRLKERGVLVLQGKLVNVAASDAVLDDKPVESSAPASAVTTPAAPAQEHGTPSYAQARVVYMTYQAKLKRLEFDRQQGKLIDADAEHKQNSDIARAIRDGMLAIPGRLAPVFAAETEAKKIETQMLEEIKRALARIADAINAI